MTFDEWVQNPFGKKSAVVSNLQMFRQMYADKWDKLLLRENGIINYRLYKSGDNYYAHFKIPSEVVEKFYYDTIVRFYPSGSPGIIRSLKDMEVQFWSNDPSFVYTYCNAYKKHGMLIRDLDSKMSVAAIKEKPVEKNPNRDIGYVKSIFFLYLALKQFHLFSKAAWDNATPYTKKIWSAVVTHADDKVKDRQELGEALRKKEKRLATDKTTKSQRQTPAHATSVKFGSPNQKDFGHFKKTNYNTIGFKIKKEINNGIKKVKHAFK